jgi:hypothetical protein
VKWLQDMDCSYHLNGMAIHRRINVITLGDYDFQQSPGFGRLRHNGARDAVDLHKTPIYHSLYMYGVYPANIQ